MKKDTINLATIEVAKVWQPTMMLRWNESNIYCPIRDEFKKTLQQMWTSNLGDIEWKDIPIEEAQSQPSCLAAVSGSALREGWLDWNTLSLDQMVERLRQKFMFSSSGDAKCIYHLIEFYDKHK